MLLEFEHGLVQLARRQGIELLDGAGTTITCMSGLVWVTQERDSRDVVLGPGASFALDLPGRAVIQALVASACRFDRPGPAVSPASRAEAPAVTFVPARASC